MGNSSLDEGETSASHSKLTNLGRQMVGLHSGTSDRTAVIHVNRNKGSCKPDPYFLKTRRVPEKGNV